MKKLVLFFAFSAIMVSSCYYDNAEELYQESCDVSAVTYSEDVSIIIANNCVICHNASDPDRLDLTIYNNVFDNSVDIKRRINLPLGAPEAMPDSGPMSRCNIDKVTTWIDQGAIEN